MFQRLVHEWGNKRKRESNDHNPVLEPRQIAYVFLSHRICTMILKLTWSQQGESEALLPLLCYQPA